MVLYDTTLVSYVVALAHYALEYGLYGSVDGWSFMVTACIDGLGVLWTLVARGAFGRAVGYGGGGKTA
jgi:hypothetical protein